MSPGSSNYDRALRSAQGFLLPDEEVVVATNKHWVVVAEPILTCLLVFVAVTWVNVASNSPGGDLLWWVWFAFVLRALWSLFEWRRSWFIATDQRLLLVGGIVVRKVAMMPLKKVTDLTYDRTIPGQILRYGTFRFETAGQDQGFSRLDKMPQPNSMYRAIVEYVLGGPKEHPQPPKTRPADPTPTKPMTIDFGDRSHGRDSALYRGGDRRAHEHEQARRPAATEPDTEPFVIPESWRRTDDEVAPPNRPALPPAPAQSAPHQLTGDPVDMTARDSSSGTTANRQVGSWFRRAKNPGKTTPQHHSLDEPHWTIRGPSQASSDRTSRNTGPIIEVKGQRRRRGGDL